MKTLTIDPQLKYDSDVEYLQRSLEDIRVRYNLNWGELKPDGRFGQQTLTAVKNFQTFAEINNTGIVDDLTWYRIDEKLGRNSTINPSVLFADSDSSLLPSVLPFEPSNLSTNEYIQGRSEDGTPLFFIGASVNQFAVQPASGEQPLRAMPEEINIVEAGMKTTIAVTGIASTTSILPSKYLKWNEVCHKTKNSGTSFVWQSKWNRGASKTWRAKQVATVSKARAISKGATKVGGVFLGADIALSGEIRPSHVINGAMLGASATGIGAIAAGAWFIADFGTMGYNRLFHGEWKSLGDIIDEEAEERLGKYGKIELYEGLY